VANGVTNLDGFDDFIDDAVGGIEEEATEIVQKTGLQLWGSITDKTPVDTGRARASWNMAWGEPDGSVPSEGEHEPPEPEIKGKLRPGGTFHISSNLHDISYLEEGTPGPGSDQAPQGMVKTSIQKLERFFS